jgi:formaldehyde-activating enzyme involved in methanogenesis
VQLLLTKYPQSKCLLVKHIQAAVTQAVASGMQHSLLQASWKNDLHVTECTFVALSSLDMLPPCCCS